MIEVAAAVILKNDQVFLSSRPADKPPAGWEFPGGKLENGENCFEAVARELQEELAWKIIPLKHLYTLHRENLVIHFILCSPAPGSTPNARENQQFKWVKLSPDAPDDLLANDIEFWNFLIKAKIKHELSAL